MFQPCHKDKFLDFNGAEVIKGPNDRAIFGFDNYFPKQWLIEDYGFTLEEANWLIARVNEQVPSPSSGVIA